MSLNLVSEQLLAANGTLAVTVVAVPLRTALFGGVTGSGADLFVAWMHSMGQNLVESVAITVIGANLVDKILTAVIVWLLLRQLPIFLFIFDQYSIRFCGTTGRERIGGIPLIIRTYATIHRRWRIFFLLFIFILFEFALRFSYFLFQRFFPGEHQLQ